MAGTLHIPGLYDKKPVYFIIRYHTINPIYRHLPGKVLQAPLCQLFKRHKKLNCDRKRRMFGLKLEI